MMTITEFLTARYDEDEAVAREVQAEIRRQLEAGQYLPGHGPDPDEAGMYHGDGPMDHPSVIVGPATVLADIAAKRAIVAEFEQVHADYQVHHTPTLEGQRFGLMKALSMLLQPYAEHPDFDPTWRI